MELTLPFPIGRCEVVLGEFLKEIKKNPSSVKFAEMANILVIHCQTTGERVEACSYSCLLRSPHLSYLGFSMGPM